MSPCAELLACFVELDNIRQHFKSRLVGSTVLNGYLSLRKLIVQRTKLIDETQDKLLELLEEMTTGMEEETPGTRRAGTWVTGFGRSVKHN